MGRLTPSFTQVYFELLDMLRKQYVPLLRDREHREAFEALVHDGWDRERAAMSNAEIALVLDVLSLTASVHNKGEAERLRRRMDEIQETIEKLEGSTESSVDSTKRDSSDQLEPILRFRDFEAGAAGHPPRGRPEPNRVGTRIRGHDEC